MRSPDWRLAGFGAVFLSCFITPVGWAIVAGYTVGVIASWMADAERKVRQTYDADRCVNAPLCGLGPHHKGQCTS